LAFSRKYYLDLLTSSSYSFELFYLFNHHLPIMTVKDNDPRDQIPHISPPPSQRELLKLGSQAVIAFGIFIVAWILLFG